MVVVVVVVVYSVVMGVVDPLVTWTKEEGQPSARGPESCQDRGGALRAGRALGLVLGFAPCPILCPDGGFRCCTMWW